MIAGGLLVEATVHEILYSVHEGLGRWRVGEERIMRERLIYHEG